MTDLMMKAIIRMPYEMAMESHLSRRQYYERANQALDLIESQNRNISEADWQPIETAPKDGTVLLLFARHRTATASTVVVGAFIEGQWLASSYVGQGEAVIVPSAWMHRPPFPDQSTPA